MVIPRRAIVFLTLAWVLVVLYPDPGVLVRSIGNTVRPRVDPAAASALAARLPDDPRQIEAYVLKTQVPYAYDWQTAGVPWYFPTAAEALAAGAGDCESRAMVLASVLTAKGIPNELRMSLDHIWVDYPGKRDTAIETAGLEIAGRRDGKLFVQLPQEFDLQQEIADQLDIYWRPAPPWRVALLFAGLTLLPLMNVVARLLGDGYGTLGAVRLPGRVRRRTAHRVRRPASVR